MKNQADCYKSNVRRFEGIRWKYFGMLIAFCAAEYLLAVRAIGQRSDWEGQQINVVLLRIHRSDSGDETAAGIYVGSNNQNAYFVTPSHALLKEPKDEESGLVDTVGLQFRNNPDQISALVVKRIDSALDLGVVRIPIAALPSDMPKLVIRAPALELSIHVIGHPPAGNWSAWTGSITNENAANGDVHHFTTNTNQSLTGGYSGGAVYDSHGNIVGMHIGGTNTYGKNLKAADIVLQLSGWNVPTNNLVAIGDMHSSKTPPDVAQPLTDPVKDACMKGSIVDCQNYAGRIHVKCNFYDMACKLLVTCWEDKARALEVLQSACKQNPETCEFQRANMRAQISVDCDKKTLSDF